MSKPKIALIGHVCIDRNKSENSSYESWGSSVIYMADYLATAHWLKANIITSYGLDMLQHLPPRISLMPAAPSLDATLVYENDSRSGKRVQHCYAYKESIPPALESDVVRTVSEADIIIVAPLLSNYPRDYLEKLLRKVKPQAIKVLCPQGYFRHIEEGGRVTFQDFKDLGAIASLFDLVFYSEEDHPDAIELAKRWSHNSNTQFIVTQAAAGASIVHEGKIINIPTTPIPLEQIIDSVGCGDVFAASATYSYYRSRNLPTSIHAAHKAAKAKLLNTPQFDN